jgi:hypothetical protein
LAQHRFRTHGTKSYGRFPSYFGHVRVGIRAALAIAYGLAPYVLQKLRIVIPKKFD